MQNTREMWIYRSSLGMMAQADLEGFDVQATDGSIGHVDEATNDVDRQSIVVDTGPWIFGRKVILPAATVDSINLDDRIVTVGLTKDQIKDSPEYDPDRYDDEYRDRLAAYYNGYTS